MPYTEIYCLNKLKGDVNMNEEEKKEAKETFETKNFLTRETMKQANTEEAMRKIYDEVGIDYLC